MSAPSTGGSQGDPAVPAHTDRHTDSHTDSHTDGEVVPAGDGSATPAMLGEVLGPLPVWAATAVTAALCGEVLGERLADGELGASVGPWLTGALAQVWTIWVPAVVSIGLLMAITVVARRTDVRGHRRHLGVAGILMVILAVLPGSAVRVVTAEVGLLPQLADQGGARAVQAKVVHEPRPIATGWHVLVRITELDGVATRERAALTLDADRDPPPLGSRWDAEVTARPLPDGGYGRWLGRQHASVVLDVRRWERRGSPGWLAAASEHVRERIRTAATRHLADRTGGLLVGFVSGDTRLLPEDDQEAMRATSLTHLTAVSGANVAIVVGGVLLFLGALRVGARWRRRIIAVTIVAFAFLTRFEPSVLRAGSMALLVLLVAARGMPRDTRHALCGAVLLLVLLDPRLAGSLGLLLSATATAGVLMVAPLVAERLPRLPRRLREVISITIGAQVAVVPLLLTTFGEVPLGSVPANIVAVPAAAVAAVLSFLGALLALAHVELGAPLFWLAGGPARVVLASAHGFAGVGGVADVARPVTVVALVAGCGWVLTRPGSRSARWSAAVTACAVLLAGMPMLGGVVSPRTMVVTAIDVGQGDAFLIETPEVRILVDAGGDDTAARWLRRHGRRHLDLVVVTHPHLDHVGGVPEVLRRVRVDAVWYRPLPTELPEAAEVIEVARERGVPIRGPVAGEVVALDDVLLEVLHPPPGRPYRWSGSELNDTSIVVRATHGRQRVLATGDVEVAAQGDLLSTSGDQLRAELLTVPHHGAATTDPAFLAAVAPRVGLIGVGADNPYGHPHPDIVAVLEHIGAEVRRTDLEGTVRVTVPATRQVSSSRFVAGVPRAARVRRRHGGPGCRPRRASIDTLGKGHRCPSS